MRVSTPACAKASAECVEAIPAPQYSVISRWTSTPAASTVKRIASGDLSVPSGAMCVTVGMLTRARNVAGGGIEPGREPAVVLRGSDVDEVAVDRGTGGVVDRRDPWVDVERDAPCRARTPGRRPRAAVPQPPTPGCRRRARGCRPPGGAGATTRAPPRRRRCRHMRRRGRRRRSPSRARTPRGAAPTAAGSVRPRGSRGRRDRTPDRRRPPRADGLRRTRAGPPECPGASARRGRAPAGQRRVLRRVRSGGSGGALDECLAASGRAPTTDDIRRNLGEIRRRFTTHADTFRCPAAAFRAHVTPRERSLRHVMTAESRAGRPVHNVAEHPRPSPATSKRRGHHP